MFERMKSTRVKICGITTPEDVEAAAAVGADAIGFNFYPPSPRYVELERATELSRRCPPFVSAVALFVNPEPDEVQAVLQAVPGVSVLQFHGTETPEFCGSFARPYIKSIGVHNEVDVIEEMSRYATASALLLDSFDPVRWGGTGREFDWNKIPAERLRPLVLAGGLNAGNVEGAIRQVKPFAVDVCNGVESSPGIKDPVKLEAFMRSVERVSR